jgi:ABC-type phosphate/phosphonate transport system substrate-binding protein
MLLAICIGFVMYEGNQNRKKAFAELNESLSIELGCERFKENGSLKSKALSRQQAQERRSCRKLAKGF